MKFIKFSCLAYETRCLHMILNRNVNNIYCYIFVRFKIFLEGFSKNHCAVAPITMMAVF